ncbi:MAG TPA: ATP synthase F1 subunit gamma [Candidatus Pacearchaeota archaeon]|mgnify:FL=1|jgi:F-type H+-transporting ATPase subunit gamma|nr:ATP synthase F1 subunit gamma [Candidatus Pacearchaeota archaeon]
MELKEIRLKIESVANIHKLTGALETLSALKMKKSQKIALESRPFAQRLGRLIRRVEPTLRDKVKLRKRKLRTALAVVIASDRGFCGSFNQNILKNAENEIKKLEKKSPVTVLPVGKKAIAFFKKRDREFKRSVVGVGDYGTLEELKPLADFIIKAYIASDYQRVYLMWTDFISTFRQKPKMMQLLPLEWKELKEFAHQAETDAESAETMIEPSAEMLVKEIIPQMVMYLIYQCVLESNASEHSARMTAMRNASDNARERVAELTLEYNKARQEQITKEVCEISSAKEVLG